MSIFGILPSYTTRPQAQVASRLTSDNSLRLYMKKPVIILAFLIVLGSTALVLIRVEEASFQSSEELNMSAQPVTPGSRSDNATEVKIEQQNTTSIDADTSTTLNTPQSQVEVKVNGNPVSVSQDGHTSETITTPQGETRVDITVDGDETYVQSTITGNSETDTTIQSFESHTQVGTTP